MKRYILQPLGFAALTITALTANVWAQSSAGSGTGSGAGSTAGSNSTSSANAGNSSATASGGASGSASGNTGRNAGGTSGGSGAGTPVTGGLQGQGTGNLHSMNMQHAGGAGMMGMPSPLMPAPLQQAGDQLFALKASQGNSAEVATSQLALAKSQDARVRQFAERMIADHTRANDELTPLGARAGVVLPKPPGVMHQATARLLQTLEGAEFDRQYLAGQVEAHENSVMLFHHQALHGQDSQLRAYANRYLPALIGHTAMVYGLARDMSVPGIGERPLAMLTSPGMMTMPGMAGMHGAGATGGTGGNQGNNQGGNQGGGSSAGSAGGQSRGGNTGSSGGTGTGAGSGAGSAGGNRGAGGSGSGAGSTGNTGTGGTGTGGLGGTR